MQKCFLRCYEVLLVLVEMWQHRINLRFDSFVFARRTGTTAMATRSRLATTTAGRTGSPWMFWLEVPQELLRSILQKLEARFMPSGMHGVATVAQEICRVPDRARWLVAR